MSAPIAFERLRLVLFDLDGTLVDSVGDLAWCGNETLRRLGLPERAAGAARAWVGNGLERFIKRLLTGEMEAEPEPELLRAASGIFTRLYERNISARSTVYPGVAAALGQLAQQALHLACVTNKPEPFTSRLLEALDLAAYFELVVAGNTTARKKPDPMPLHYAADHFGLEYRDCLMVGDSSNDVKAARAAGFSVICVPYGYNHGEDIRAAEPDLVVANLAELPGLFSARGLK